MEGLATPQWGRTRLPIWWIPRILAFCDGRTVASAFATCRDLHALGARRKTEEGAWAFLLSRTRDVMDCCRCSTGRRRYIMQQLCARLLSAPVHTARRRVAPLQPRCVALLPPRGFGPAASRRTIMVGCADGAVAVGAVQGWSDLSTFRALGRAPSPLELLIPCTASSACAVTTGGDLVAVCVGQQPCVKGSTDPPLHRSAGRLLCSARCHGWGVVAGERAGRSARPGFVILIDGGRCRQVASVHLPSRPVAVAAAVGERTVPPDDDPAAAPPCVVAMGPDRVQVWTVRRETEGGGTCSLSLRATLAREPAVGAAPAPSVAAWELGGDSGGVLLLWTNGAPRGCVARLRWGSKGSSRVHGVSLPRDAGWEAVEGWPGLACGHRHLAAVVVGSGSRVRARLVGNGRREAPPTAAQHTVGTGGEPVRVWVGPTGVVCLARLRSTEEQGSDTPPTAAQCAADSARRREARPQAAAEGDKGEARETALRSLALMARRRKRSRHAGAPSAQ